MVIGSQNAYIVKRKGVQFSRDPLNLVNLHSRKVSSHGSCGSKPEEEEEEEEDANSGSSTAVSSTPRYARTTRFYTIYEDLREGHKEAHILMRNLGCWHLAR